MPRYCSALLAPFAFLLCACPLSARAQVEPRALSIPQPDEQDPPPYLVVQDETAPLVEENVIVEQIAPEQGPGEEFVYGEDVWEEDDDGAQVRWTIQVDALFLRRSSREAQPLVNGDTPYSVADLDLPFRFGPRVSIVRHGLLGSMWDAEVTYFGVDGWSDQATSANATAYLTTPAINFGARTVSTRYNSSLYSTEINLRRRLGSRYTFLTGFRWIELRDNLFTDLVGASHTVDVNNHLYGYQVGTEAWLVTIGRLDLSGWLKAGLYGNSADQTTTAVNVAGAAPPFGVRGGHVAFAGELGLTGAYWINDWLAARAGYQVLWLDSMVTAAPQIPSSNVATGAAVLDFSDTLIYHGGFFGLEATW